MAWQVVNLPALQLTSVGSSFTNAIGSLDDAENITLFFTSSAATLSSGNTIQISQFDPAIVAPTGVTQSTNFFNLSSGVGSTAIGISTAAPGKTTLTLTAIGFRGLRIGLLSSVSGSTGEVIAHVTKQIFV